MRVFDVTNTAETIPLGRKGENYALKVRFPVDNWAETYGDGGNFSVLNQRNGDRYSYAASITMENSIENEQEKTYVCWNVTRRDTAFAGDGRVELLYLIDGAVAKSVIYSTTVEDAIDDGDVFKYVDVSEEGQ